ncbi:transketolase [Roseateles sp. BYS87W]|uniref:Transketolase n=1 Tax=Pelomonas baiyunensis TaxID=3299026 RepID=A0ABW7GSU6_9BURK
MHDLTLAANALRLLAIDAVQQANSGHPGMPMGMADIAAVLWARHLRHNPADPAWPDRDRFVLSNGHGSMLLYGLLHLSGYDLSMDELRRFRQLHSQTPGHPEFGITPGVETSTGPLGQGLANAVGMALAEQLLAAEFNTPEHTVISHRTFAFVGDGCLMEGLSHEACSLAGTWGLGKLVVIYDDNGISIDGDVKGWFGDDTPARFEAYGWRVIRHVDGHNLAAIDAALQAATQDCGRPTLICARTVIGQGAPNKAGGHDVHGAPLGAAEVAAVRAALHWPHPPFEVPDAARAPLDARSRGAAAQAAWQARFDAFRQAQPERAAELQRRLQGELPPGFEAQCAAQLAAVDQRAETIASRKASQNSLTALAGALPELLGGSADLAPSNLTQWKGCRSVVRAAEGGNYLHYGVREFAMVAIQTGLTLHGGVRPFAGTFLMFSEYARNAIRMAALMRINPIYVFTHDSIGLGEDGPTHQPVEQTATLRLVPNLDVWRPGDAVETEVAWQTAVRHRRTPTALILSRQNLPHQRRDATTRAAIEKGGYVLVQERTDRPLQLVLIATGSELDLAVQAQAQLAALGVNTRVVSMPSCFMFEQQEAAWRRAVLPPGVPRVAVEAGVTAGWRQYVGLEGAVVGIDTFGESAPAGDLARHFGMTVAAVVDAAQRCVQSAAGQVR